MARGRIEPYLSTVGSFQKKALWPVITIAFGPLAMRYGGPQMRDLDDIAQSDANRTTARPVKREHHRLGSGVRREQRRPRIYLHQRQSIIGHDKIRAGQICTPYRYPSTLRLFSPDRHRPGFCVARCTGALLQRTYGSREWGRRSVRCRGARREDQNERHAVAKGHALNVPVADESLK